MVRTVLAKGAGRTDGSVTSSEEEDTAMNDEESTRYVNGLLLSMIGTGTAELVLRRSEPMPEVTVGGAPAQGDFVAVTNRLKSMCSNLEPIAYDEPVYGKIVIRLVGRKDQTVALAFDDSAPDPWCRIRVRARD